MTEVLLGVIAVILLGLPLLALGLDRVLPQARARPAPKDTVRELSRRHHLTTRELLEVQAAVREGRAVTTERIAPAAVEHAIHVAGLDAFDRPPGRQVRPRTRQVLVVVYGVLVVGYLGYGLTSGNESFVVFGVIYGLQAVVLGPLQHRASRRRRATALAARAANQALVDADGAAA